ncbi:MAG: AAA family ATPase [Candidatus Kariarchaeaceae archaeon]
MNKKLFFGITGKPGSGKTIAAKCLEKHGFRKVSMGDIIRKHVELAGLPPTSENCNNFVSKVREEKGLDIIAKLTWEEIKDLDSDVVIDGIRAPVEVTTFNESSPDFLLISIKTSAENRFKRLVERGRADAPKTIEEFEHRDEIEMDLGIAEVIKKADVVFENNGSIEEFNTHFNEWIITDLLK